MEGHDRAIAIHFPRPLDSDPTVLMRRAATCLKKKINQLNAGLNVVATSSNSLSANLERPRGKIRLKPRCI